MEGKLSTSLPVEMETSALSSHSTILSSTLSTMASTFFSSISSESYTTPTEIPIIATEYDMEMNTTMLTGNSTSPFSWGWNETIKTVIFTPIVLFAILGNFLAILAFITRFRHMKSPTHFFIANLALADFLVGLLCLPFLASTTVTGKWHFGPEFCFAYIIMHLWFCSCSIYSTTAICVERYIGVRYPLNHKKIMSIPRVLCIVIFIWVYGGMVTFASVYIWREPAHPAKEECPEKQCKSNPNIGHVLFSTVFILYIPVVIMVVLYFKIYRIASKHLEVMRNKGCKFTRPRNGKDIRDSVMSSSATVVTIDESSVGNNNKGGSGATEDASSDVGNGKKSQSLWQFSVKKNKIPSTDNLVKATSSKKHINLAKRLVILVGILLISYVPYYTVWLITTIDKDLLPPQVFGVLKWMRYFNSALNPFLYAFAVPAYRKAFVGIVINRKLCS